MASGWERVGNWIGGGNKAAAQAAGEKRLAQLYLMADRDQRLKRQVMETSALDTGIGDAIDRLGVPEGERDLIVALARGKAGSNYAAAERGLTTRSVRDLHQSASDAALAGDYEKANAYAMGLVNKPVDLTKISGGVAYNPTQTPDSADVTLTPVGLADVAGKRARAARAGSRSAKAPMSDQEAAARIAFIVEEAKRIARTRGSSWSNAWAQDKAAKMHLTIDPKDLGDTGMSPEQASPPGRPAPAAAAVNAPAINNARAARMEEAAQALNDARRAVATGRITKEEAKKRLRDAGFVNTAERI